MFNKRSFLLGLGIGIIVGAMLLQLFRLGEESQNRLDEIGQQIESGDLPTATVAPTEAAEPSAPEATASDSEASGTTEGEPSQAADADSAKEPSETPKATPEASAASAEPFVVRIEPGMSVTETAELLLKAEAIEDSELFIDEMKSSGLQVRAGYFLFEKAPVDARSAASIVSGKPISAKQAEQYVVKRP